MKKLIILTLVISVTLSACGSNFAAGDCILMSRTIDGATERGIFLKFDDGAYWYNDPRSNTVRVRSRNLVYVTDCINEG